ncbi:RNA polymerase sigma factor [Actinomadura sp. K4S16]|uniref:RNA polymerase sigma factor n=1 Tax=Actinomadura sp. K4S16 TaxID=1316147 RepID=UPI0011F02398|nr:sigma-70 family RNA polymerase sigma factor [Actinomadura sp. K4S16]
MPRLSTSPHAADRQLVKGLNEGDEAALAALYDEYGERLYDYALSMSGDEKAAADIVHDAFIDACRRAPRMRDPLFLSSWLYGAARRRCIRRGRPKVLFWDLDGEFSDAPFLERAETADPAPDRPPSDELHDLLRASLSRLEPVDQEVMLLAYRHGLRPVRLGAALGLSGRRAAVRVRRARAQLDAALRREIDRARRECAAAADAAEESRSAAIPVLAAARIPAPEEEAPPEESSARGLRRFFRRGGDDSPVDPATELHAAGCGDCRARAGVTAAALLRQAPAPVLPAALRHRVMHTATDPELAGYRADIAARGGTLTPAGLPSQPDVPSPFTRRWLFTGGGMAGALAAALVVAFVMGPGIGGGTLSWPPFRTHPQPSITQERPGGQGKGKGGPEGPDGGAQARPGQPPPQPQTHEKNQEKPEDPSQTPRPPASESPKPPGILVVNPAKVEMYGTKTAQVSLKAQSGPVSWTAMTSSNQLILSQMQGGMPEDGTMRLTVTLRTALIGLPGQGTITFTDSEGSPHEVKVVWGATLL